ncbi:MAG TPA: hypothetical protein VEJ20_00020 [Candidatus Eremiobacteraceae bacterium]|nr:hypothetical protein [Candidatus Eremiobacteraceae bacterium]
MPADDDRLSPRGGVLVGRPVRVRRGAPEPTYFSSRHRARVGTEGVVHAVVARASRDNPLIKVKFADDVVLFFNLDDLEAVSERSAP